MWSSDAAWTRLTRRSAARYAGRETLHAWHRNNVNMCGRGTQNLLIPKPHYDARFDTDDGDMPMTVAPGADSAGMQSQALGDTPRLVLLAVAGTHVPSSIPFGGDEPSLEPEQVYRHEASGWHKVAVAPSWQDIVLDTTPGGAVRLSLVDAYLNVVPQTAFRVHRCPRAEHLTEETPPPPPCTLGPVDSEGTTGILPSLALNEPGGERGYLGVESIGTIPYRVRIAANHAERDSQAAEYRGGFAICTVHGVKLLNEDLAPITKTLNMSLNRAVYLQEIDPDKDGDSYQSDVVLHNEDSQEDFTLSNVAFWRVGKTPSFLTGLITVVSPDPPLAPPAAAWNEGISMQLDARVQNTSPAGTLTPTSGRYRVFRGSGTSRLAVAPGGTRLVEIVTATSNFDGVRVGRQWVSATVKWLADGYAAVAMQNVDNPAVYTFEYWQGKPLTTDLRQGSGLRVKGLADPGDGVQFSVAGQTAVFPPGGIGFKPLVPPVAGDEESTIRTVNPGLYRLRARWGRNAGLALETDYDPWCWTDKPELGICENDWIVSVGQRIWLNVEQAARTGLQNDLQTKLGIADTAEGFLDAVVAEVNAKYSEASANVVVSLTDAMPKPYLRHAVRDQLEPIPPKNIPNYGQTLVAPTFPLLDPGVDLAKGNDANFGISRLLLYEGKFHDGNEGNWADHEPGQPRNKLHPCNLPLDPQRPDLDTNPCPRDVLFNRWVSVLTHETAHGFGVVASTSYPLHAVVPAGPQPQTSLVAVQEVWSGLPDNTYNEQDTPNNEFHEPILGSNQVEASEWVMTFGIFRWNGIGRTPAFSDPDGAKWSYDQNPPDGRPVNWLVFDRPLRFSLSVDFPAVADRSIQRFFLERLPVCSETRYCR